MSIINQLAMREECRDQSCDACKRFKRNAKARACYQSESERGKQVRPMACEMKKDCTSPVTHIGENGFIYCAQHAELRRNSGRERCRRMRVWELHLVAEGKVLPSYRPKKKGESK